MLLIRSIALLQASALWTVLSLSAISALVHAQKCTPPSTAKRVEVEAYVLKRFNVASTADLILVESKQGDHACFWQFRYEVSTSKKEISLFLSPDGNYLLPTLYDIRVDPLIEEKAREAEIGKALLVDDPPALGDEKASVTIVEFSDFQCPYCKRMADILEHDFLPTVKQNVRLVYKSFPLPMHSWATAAAKMSECVELQKPSDFWKVHDYLFEHQKELNPGNLRENLTTFLIANTGIDKAQFQSCVEKDLATGPVNKDVELGRKYGVHATPTIFINGVLYSGLKSADQLKSLIAETIGGVSSSNVASTSGSPVEISKTAKSTCQGTETKTVQ